MTTKLWVNFFCQSWHNVGKSGRDFKKWVWQAVYIFHGFPHDIIIFPIGYKIGEFFFCSLVKQMCLELIFFT